MNYRTIDIDNWERKDYFNFMTQVYPTKITITKHIDITEFYRTVQDNDLKFTPTVYYCIGTVVNQLESFKYAMLNNELVQLEKLDVLYTIFHEDTKLFTNLWTEFDYDYETFIDNYTTDIKMYKKSTNMMAKPVELPIYYFVSNNTFTSFDDMHVDIHDGGTTLLPRIFLGRKYEKGGRLFLPLVLLVNHAVCDGYHMGLFLNAFQNLLDTFDPSYKGMYELDTTIPEEIRV